MKLTEVDISILLSLASMLSDQELARLSLLCRKMQRRIRGNLLLENRILRAELKMVCVETRKEVGEKMGDWSPPPLAAFSRVRVPSFRQQKGQIPIFGSLRRGKLAGGSADALPIASDQAKSLSLTPEEIRKLEEISLGELAERSRRRSLGYQIKEAEEIAEERLDELIYFISDTREEIEETLRFTGRGIRSAVRNLLWKR